MWDRRAFLKFLVGATAGLSGGAAAASVSQPRRKVIVVGAGVAGLAAARKLIESGREVQVIEARDRIGGRVFTSNIWTDAPMDLGASWIHGTRGNPISALARDAGAPVVPTAYENSVCYETSGAELDADGRKRLNQLGKSLSRCIESAQDAEHDQSIEAAVSKLLNSKNLTPEERKMSEFFLNSTIEQEYAGSIAELSCHWYDSDSTFPGGDALFPKGYQAIPDFLAKGVDVKLGETVRRIEWSSQHAIVETSKAVHKADCVLVTLPLGVLKTGAVEFAPGLPPTKRQAISALGMGTLNKCLLRFPSTFWPTSVDWLEYIPEKWGQWTEWVNFSHVCGEPVLMGFNAADFGREIEKWTDREIVADAMRTLRTIFGNQIPNPSDAQITRWATDPFAMGSYSFTAIGSKPTMRDELAAPVDGRIFFAGEATDRKYFGTVHGAYLSGLRAASQILTAA